MTYSDKSRHNQDSSAQLVPLSELRDRVARSVISRLDGFGSFNWKPEEYSTDWDLYGPSEHDQAKWVADAAIAEVLAFFADPDTKLPRQAIYDGKMATFDALGADEIERVIRAVAQSLKAQQAPAISEGNARHSGEAQ